MPSLARDRSTIILFCSLTKGVLEYSSTTWWHKMKYVKSSKTSEVKTSQKNAKNVLPRHQRSDHHISLITLKAIHCRKPDLIHICWISWQQPCAALITQQLLSDEHQLSLVRCQNDDGGFGYTTLHQIISQPDCHVCFLSVDLRQTHLGFALTTWVGPQKDVWCHSGHFTTFVETAGSHFPWNCLGPTSLMVFDRSDITVIPQREINGKHVAISPLKWVEEAKKSKKTHLWNQNQKLSFSLVRSHTSFLIRRCTARTEEGTLWSSGARMRRSNMEMLTLLILASWTATKIRLSWPQGRSKNPLWKHCRPFKCKLLHDRRLQLQMITDHFQLYLGESCPGACSDTRSHDSSQCLKPFKTRQRSFKDIQKPFVCTFNTLGNCEKDV